MPRGHLEGMKGEWRRCTSRRSGDAMPSGEASSSAAAWGHAAIRRAGSAPGPQLYSSSDGDLRPTRIRVSGCPQKLSIKNAIKSLQERTRPQNSRGNSHIRGSRKVQQSTQMLHVHKHGAWALLQRVGSGAWAAGLAECHNFLEKKLKMFLKS